MRLVGPWLAAACAALACVAASAASLPSQEVLVLLEDTSLRSSHSLFFSDLRKQGFNLHFKSADDKTLRLRDWDTWLYGNLVIFASGIQDFGGAVDSESILELVDDGGGMLLAVDTNASDELRGLLGDFGLDLEKGSQVADFLRSNPVRGQSRGSVVTSADYGAVSALFGGSAPKAPVLYKGAALSPSAEGSQVMAALRGTDTTVAVSTSSQEIQLAGHEALLVSLVQARNNARVVVSGSIAMFSNQFYGATVAADGAEGLQRAGNREFASAVASWAFSQRGVLRASPLRHGLSGQPGQPEGYRINDHLEVGLDIEELRDGRWQPYVAEDVQVEFVMLDPYVRTALTPSPQGKYSVQIHVPDVYGVFKFVVDYHRPGFSSIFISEQVPVRPFRHDEYERFIVSAYPYYASAASLMVAFLMLDFVLLYRK